MQLSTLLINTGVSLLLGLLIAGVHVYKNHASKNYLLTLATLPLLVQLVILLVNGNLGTGVAVMGAFSIIRFRSVAGGAREILSVFWAMAIGLATGTSHPLYAALFSVLAAVFIILLETVKFDKIGARAEERLLKITIAEDQDEPGLFDGIFEKYSHAWDLEQVRTTQMGALYELRYSLTLKNKDQEKAMLDEIRMLNGNLPVSSGKIATKSEVL